MAFDHWRAAMEAENVWDNPAQAFIVATIAKEQHSIGYAVIAQGKLARRMGVSRRYVKKVLDILEFVKEAIQPLDYGETRGQRNRYVVTLSRAFAKVRLEAGVDADTPLWKLPTRSHGKPVPAKRVSRRGGSIDPESKEDSPPSLFDGADPEFRGGGSIDPGGGGSIDPGGRNYRSAPSAQILKSKYKEVQEAAGEDAAAPRPRVSGARSDPAPGALPLGPVSATPPIVAQVRTERTARRAALYNRVASKARQILGNPILAIQLINEPITGVEQLNAATRVLCGNVGVVGYGEVVNEATRSEWWKYETRRAVGTLVGQRGRDLAAAGRRRRARAVES